MRPEQHYRHDVTWWARSGVDNWGEPTFAAPIVVKAHWREDRVIFTNANGEERVSRVIVHVDRDMTEGDYLWLGITASTADPETFRADRIEGWRKSSIPGKNIHVRRAYLA